MRLLGQIRSNKIGSLDCRNYPPKLESDIRMRWIVLKRNPVLRGLLNLIIGLVVLVQHSHYCASSTAILADATEIESLKVNRNHFETRRRTDDFSDDASSSAQSHSKLNNHKERFLSHELVSLQSTGNEAATQSNVTITGRQTVDMLYAFLQTDCQQLNNGGFRDWNTNASWTALRLHPKHKALKYRDRICLPSMGIRSRPSFNSSQKALVSDSSSEQFLKTIGMQKAGISLIVWLKQGQNDIVNESSALLAIGRVETPEGTAENWADRKKQRGNNLTPCDQYDLDLLLLQDKNALNVLFRTSEHVFEACHRLRVQNFTTGDDGTTTMTHVAISLVDGLQQVFLNGQLVRRSFEHFSNDLSHWKKEAFENRKVVVLSHSPFLPWRGTLYQLEFISGGLTFENVKARLSQGLVPSPPLAKNVSVWIHEDAERSPNSHSPAWYNNKNGSINIMDSRKHQKQQQHYRPTTSFLRNEADTVHLPIQSVQQEGFRFVDSLGLYTVHQTALFHRYITRLPLNGELFLKNGRPVVPHDTDPSDFQQQYSSSFMDMWEIMSSDLIYLPQHNAHSKKSSQVYNYNDEDSALRPFDSFEYCVSLHPILHARDCDSATVTMYVRPVNDPPIAAYSGPNKNDNNQSIVVYEGVETGRRTPKILLTGTDVDVGDYIQSVKITSPPEYGSLVLYVGTFRPDRLPHGTLLHDVNYTLRDGPVHVQYRWDPQTKFFGSLQPVVQDQFSFVVSDQWGYWSMEETVSLEIHSALLVIFDDNQTFAIESVPPKVNRQDGKLEKESSVNLKLLLLDNSGFNRSLGLYIDLLPLPSIGKFIDPSSEEPISNGTIMFARQGMSISSKGGAFVNVSFVPSTTLCTESTKQLHDVSFHTKAVAFDPETERLTSASERKEQHFKIYCRPSPLEWSIGVESTVNDTDHHYLTVLESHPRLSSLDPCSGGNFNVTAPSSSRTNCSQRTLFFHNISIQSVTPLSWFVDPVVVEIRSQTGYLTLNEQHWNKTQPRQGRRLESQGTVGFEVYPVHIESVLSILHYQSPTPGRDSMELVLYQGNCSGNHAIHDVASSETATLRKDKHCHVARHAFVISVQVDPDQNQYETSLISGFQWQILVCLIGYPLIYLVMVQIELWFHSFVLNHSSSSSTLNDEKDNDGDDSSGDANRNNNTEENCAPQWIQYETEQGDFYYQSTSTGEITWMAPVGEMFLRWWEEPQNNDELQSNPN